MTAYVTFGVDPAIVSAIWYTETNYSTGMSPTVNRDENGNKTSTDWGPLQLNDYYKLGDHNWQNKYNPSGTDLTQDPWAAFFVAAHDLADHGAGKQNPNLNSGHNILAWFEF